MNISPTARYLLTAMAAGVAALGALQTSGDLTDLPDWVGIVVAVLSATFGALNIVPPQVGGTQEGVVNPSITEPPAADVHERPGGGLVGYPTGRPGPDDEAGFSEVSFLLVLAGVANGVVLVLLL